MMLVRCRGARKVQLCRYGSSIDAWLLGWCSNACPVMTRRRAGQLYAGDCPVPLHYALNSPWKPSDMSPKYLGLCV